MRNSNETDQSVAFNCMAIKNTETIENQHHRRQYRDNTRSNQATSNATKISRAGSLSAMTWAWEWHGKSPWENPMQFRTILNGCSEESKRFVKRPRPARRHFDDRWSMMKAWFIHGEKMRKGGPQRSSVLEPWHVLSHLVTSCHELPRPISCSPAGLRRCSRALLRLKTLRWQVVGWWMWNWVDEQSG